MIEIPVSLIIQKVIPTVIVKTFSYLIKKVHGKKAWMPIVTISHFNEETMSKENYGYNLVNIGINFPNRSDHVLKTVKVSILKSSIIAKIFHNIDTNVKLSYKKGNVLNFIKLSHKGEKQHNDLNHSVLYTPCVQPSSGKASSRFSETLHILFPKNYSPRDIKKNVCSCYY